MSSYDVTLPGGKRQSSEDLLAPWIARRKAGLKARRPFEAQWMTAQAFAAGKQWVVYSPRDHRVLEDPRRKASGRSMLTVDVLTQYLWTAIGKFSKDDFRPELLFQHADEEGTSYATQANKAFGWGWDEEWKGDDVLLDVLRTIVTFGTAGVRARFDANRGQLQGDAPIAPEQGHSFQDPTSGELHNTDPGQPIMHPPAARDFVASSKYYGEELNFANLHEGAIVWELLSPWNLIPPPAVESERDFHWEMVVRPVHVDEIKQMYPDRGDDVSSDEIEAMSILGLKDMNSAPGTDTPLNAPAGPSSPATSQAKLEDHALVYTGYLKPCPDYPKGQTAVFTHGDRLLDLRPDLPITPQNGAPRSGISYFHYWKVKQRFWARALMDAGIGPQRIRNKRLSQVDEHVDRGQAKVYAEKGSIVDTPAGVPVEVVEMEKGSPKPVIDPGIPVGSWMFEAIQLEDENIEKALGLHSASLGQSFSSSAPYARIALETENDSDKLDPIARDFKIGVSDLSRDSLELMRKWPDGKQLLIAGENDILDALAFQRSMIPPNYMVRPAKGGALPRNQGAEIQKIVDIWTAALQSGIVAQNPQAWLDWYKRSLDAGKAEDLPEMGLGQEQRHKAALENVVMARTGQPVPVADYDDPQIHVTEHTEEELRLSAAATQAADDPTIAAGLAAVQQHKLMHLQQAQMNAMTAPPQALPPGPPPPPGPQPPPQ